MPIIKAPSDCWPFWSERLEEMARQNGKLVSWESDINLDGLVLVRVDLDSVEIEGLEELLKSSGFLGDKLSSPPNEDGNSGQPVSLEHVLELPKPLK